MTLACEISLRRKKRWKLFSPIDATEPAADDKKHRSGLPMRQPLRCFAALF